MLKIRRRRIWPGFRRTWRSIWWWRIPSCWHGGKKKLSIAWWRTPSRLSVRNGYVISWRAKKKGKKADRATDVTQFPTDKLAELWVIALAWCRAAFEA
jgi:hypothetical protein